MDLPQLTETISEVSPDDTFAVVEQRMSERQAKITVVIHNGTALGIIAARDIARHKAIPGRDMSVLLAREVMSAPVETMLASTPVIDAAHDMRSRRIQYLALVNDTGAFEGLVTLRRVLFDVMDELDLKVDNLERELMADGPGG